MDSVDVEERRITALLHENGVMPLPAEYQRLAALLWAERRWSNILLRILKIKKKPFSLENDFFSGTSGDTELFKKASKINGLQGCRTAFILNMNSFRAAVLHGRSFSMPISIVLKEVGNPNVIQLSSK